MCRISYKPIFVIFVIYSFSLFFEKFDVNANPWDEISNYPYIEPNNPALMDSLLNFNRTPIPVPCVTYLDFDLLSLTYGPILWTDVNDFRIGSLDSVKFKCQILNYFENGSIYMGYVVMAPNDSILYCRRTDCIGNDCDSLWDSEVIVNVVNNNQILFNSSVDLNVEIYKPYRIRGDLSANFLLTGNSTNYLYNFNLESNQPYVVVFRNETGKVVYIKKIIGI